jgi:uncharacterized protein (TIGR02271 family)
MAGTGTERTGMREAYEWRGRNVVDQEGAKVGRLEEVYLEQHTGRPEWMLVHTGLLGTKSSFAPLAGARVEGEDVRIGYSKQEVKDAPSVEADGELSEEEEARLYAHYGLDYSESRSDTGRVRGERVDRAPVGRDVSGPNTDDAMTRSEEELRVGTAKRERGRARLRKYVVTEEVTQSVPVQREEVRVEREPITDRNRDRATAGPDISEEEHEVVLHEEEVVTEKRAVPKERVRLDTETVTDEQTVSEQVRKEQIDTEGVEKKGGKKRRR